MKKLLFFGLLSLSVITGCKTQIYSIGVSEAEFKVHSKSANLVVKTEHETIYRKLDRTSFFDSGNTYYYYFTDGKLVRIDDKGPNPNIIIQRASN